MRAAVFVEPRRIEVTDRPDATIREPSDAIVRVVLACVCGSDLWFYRGETPFEPGPIGHEFIGVVEDVGADVHNVKKGEFVISPFAFSDGTCPHCRHGITTACVQGGFFSTGNGDGGQGEAVRVPLADGTLVGVPGSGYSDETMASLLALSDVMGTGEHAAVCARVKPGDTVAVVGDGAVGLCGVVAAKRRGAERIIALSRHAQRQQLAREFGATDIVEARGEEAIAAVLELTSGVGVDAALECVGTGQAMDTALGIARPGSMVGYVGVPHGVELPPQTMFYGNRAYRADLPRRGTTCQSSSRTCCGAASTPAACSTSRPIWTGSQRHTRRWTSAARSSRCCGSGRSEHESLDPERARRDRRRAGAEARLSTRRRHAPASGDGLGRPRRRGRLRALGQRARVGVVPGRPDPA